MNASMQHPTGGDKVRRHERQNTQCRESTRAEELRNQKSLLLERSLRTTNRQDDLNFVMGRVKKDSISTHSPSKVSTSVYHKDFHNQAANSLQKGYGFGEKIAYIRNLQERKFNCPSLYKDSSYEAQYIRPNGEAVEVRKQSNNHRIFESGRFNDTSTYQSGFRAPRKVLDETAKPVHPAPEQPFANNSRFRGESVYQREFVNLPKIARDKTIGAVDHLTDHYATHEQKQSEYKENFEPKREGSVGKCVPKCNDHFFLQAKNSFSGQFLSNYKKNYL